MDPAGHFQGGFPGIPQPNSRLVQHPPPMTHAIHAQGLQIPPPPLSHRDDVSEDGGAHRVAHTLTACTRCRQRKTRCDPSLPRCLPCERSGSNCEYYDTTKGKKISRHYVLTLQDRVRQLEADLRMLTEEEGDFSKNNEEMMRCGGLVRLSTSDETHRYLGPSSGIAMSRLLMEKAKLFTDSKRISELIPEVRARRERRMQSVVMTGTGPPKKKCMYPMFSDIPAPTLPSRAITNQLWDAFSTKGNAQMFWPVLHEPTFERDLDDVYNGSEDAYQNYVVRMVIAIGLQKNDPQYAGLADSYYQAAMQIFEEVVRPRDLRSLQCLVLLAIYSILTPSRMAIYFVLGLAVRICQGMGMTFEKTITSAYNSGLENAQTLDMRRRLFWVVSSMEFGLAHTMGRPSGLAQTDDTIDVEYFATVDDKYITEDGILPAPPSEKKLVTIYFFKMRLLQAEIRRTLYEGKRQEPTSDQHPWWEAMERKIQAWMDDSPKKPEWCIPWFRGRYNGMRIILNRPSPQVPQPSNKSVEICYESAAHIVNLSRAQMEKGAVDLTWIFLLNLYLCINTLLWSISYAHIRQAHAREDVEELVDTTLDMLEQCTERWPGTQAAVNLYSVLARACMQVYDVETPSLVQMPTFDTPASNTSSPPDMNNWATNINNMQGHPPPPQFAAFPFGQQRDVSMDVFSTPLFGSANLEPQGPAFRSGSIFQAVSSGERRFSHWAPDSQGDMDEVTPPGTVTPGPASPPEHGSHSLPSPPESLATHSSPNLQTPVQVPSHPTSPTPNRSPIPVPPAHMLPRRKSESLKVEPQVRQVPQPPNRNPAFSVQPAHQSQPPQHAPAPTIDNWSSPPAPLLGASAFNPFSAFNMNTMNSLFAMDMAPPTSAGFGGTGLGLGLGSSGSSPLASPFNMNWQRHGSLTQEQHSELMQVLENDGLADLDFMGLGPPTTHGPPAPPVPPTSQPIRWA